MLSRMVFSCMTVVLGLCRECSEDIREAAAGIMFAARWCGDLPELLLARTTLEEKFGSDFAVIAKEGAGIVDPMVINMILFIHGASNWKKGLFLMFTGVGLCYRCSLYGSCQATRQTWS